MCFFFFFYITIGFHAINNDPASFFPTGLLTTLAPLRKHHTLWARIHVAHVTPPSFDPLLLPFHTFIWSVAPRGSQPRRLEIQAHFCKIRNMIRKLFCQIRISIELRPIVIFYVLYLGLLCMSARGIVVDEIASDNHHLGSTFRNFEASKLLPCQNIFRIHALVWMSCLCIFSNISMKSGRVM